MITISKIETYVLKDTLEKSFFFSQWEYSERCICIVKITCSDGTYGWGEGYGPANILESGIEFLKAQVLGENPLHNEVIWNKMYRKTLDFARRGVLVASMSAIDIAIWDIKGKLLNQSVGSLLGGVQRKYVVPYATGMYFTEKDNLTKDFEVEAKLYLEKGFKAIKMKVGLGISKDVSNVKHLRSIIGYDIKLMIDSNHAYTYTEALELSKKLEKYEISWFEEPVSPEFYEQYAELRQKTTIPIAGGECEYLRFGFHQLLKNKSVDIIQPDICACGGLTEAKRIASLASTYGVDIVPHTWGSSIGIHVALHFISNLESLPGRMFSPDFLLEFDQTENALREQLTFPKLEMKNGKIQVPSSPGLGLEVNEDELHKFVNHNIGVVDIKELLQ
ncbi:MAG: mandelate racemase/muconate lactonizing enzyme family protein [Bacteroidota bacterium]|nr:mandelate racemase/muconate lactonizing enzyme family protein [Bacteroidota bacterium]MEC7830057.1 mandelate racemase/muconate lactonizing enzyme family protein [Bacteroidota bacterium]MEC8098461.1 mandelate racemase/muconate lactonizing enzyme family protein [Bacteroidota bacterium]MED5364323.1 mandelate racemase/muconate lactonizing enzyme family protein [Bacteroidota bacterium]|tara:strand:+ start:45 stop:1214 length:1170 start_codon:yes stop_codon:yes gene_type:complete